MSRLWFIAVAFLLLSTVCESTRAERLRVIMETDAGGDPDDEQSLIRFLLYANEWDIEGIIANRAHARQGENRNTVRTGLGIVRRIINAYGQCHTNLVQHDARFPSESELLKRTVAGYADVDDGVQRIINAVDSNDPRPVWFMNWGTDAGSADSCLKRALDRVLRMRGVEGYAKFKKRIHLSSSDKFAEHTNDIEPPFPIWVDTFRPEMEGKRWYHRFSAITARAGGFDPVRDMLTGHGPLGELYPTNTTHWLKEGDSMTFLYLIPTGMNDPMQPAWGSWGGRYGLREKNYYWASLLDSWQGTTNRDNTLKRWAVDLQNDFRARLDWCVKRFSEANHAPRITLNGSRNSAIARVTGRPGATIQLDATGTTDPDGNSLSFAWFIYSEASAHNGTAVLNATNRNQSTLKIPNDWDGEPIHVILAVRDDGLPALAAYRRVIVGR